jgi:hypothetical protein
MPFFASSIFFAMYRPEQADGVQSVILCLKEVRDERTAPA